MNLDDIIAQAPEYDGKKWAFYGTPCLFWATDLRDLKKLSDFKQSPLGNDSCCPFCGNQIKQMELDKFIENHTANETLNKFGGLEILIKAHAANAQTCRLRWDRYEVLITSPSMNFST